jgi:hypothetical protein
MNICDIISTLSYPVILRKVYEGAIVNSVYFREESTPI